MLIAKSSVKHDGKLYKSGEVIEGVSQNQAQVLIDANVAQSEAEVPQTSKVNSTKTVKENKDPMEGVVPTVKWSKLVYSDLLVQKVLK